MEQLPQEQNKFHTGVKKPRNLRFRSPNTTEANGGLQENIVVRVEEDGNDGRAIVLVPNADGRLCQHEIDSPTVHMGARLPVQENVIKDHEHVRNRRFRILQDWTDTLNSVQVKADEYGIVDCISDDRLRLEVRFVSHQSSDKYYRQSIPVGIAQLLAPVDAATEPGRTVRVVEDTLVEDNHGKSYKITAGVSGYVISKSHWANSGGQHNPDFSYQYIFIKTTDNHICMLDASRLDYGPFRSKSQGISIMHMAAPRLSHRQLVITARSTGFAGQLSQLLHDIHDNTMEAPTLSRAHLREISTAAAVQWMTSSILEGMAIVAPTLLTDIFERPHFQIGHVLTHARTYQNDNQSAGVYLRVYSDFKPDTPFHGHLPYAYLGQTGNMSRRHTEHSTKPWDKAAKAYHTKHYSVARAASKVHVVQLLQQPQGWTKIPDLERRARLREVAEQAFILLFNTYEQCILMPPQTQERGESNAAISPDVAMRETAIMLSQIAKMSLTVTRWPLAGKPYSDLGVQNGLNKGSPLDKFYKNKGEQVLWCKYYDAVAKTTKFWRAPVRLTSHHDATHDLFAIRRIQPSSNGKQLMFGSSTDEYDDQGPSLGTLVYPEIEIRDKETGPSVAPYASSPDAIPWSNVEDVLRLSLKIYWQDENDGETYVRYARLARSSNRRVKTLSAVDRGRDDAFGKVAALMAHLEERLILPKPDFVPILTPALILTLHHDYFRQRFVGRFMPADPAANAWPMVQDYARAKRVMTAAGLMNVGGRFRSLDTSWLDRLVKEGKISTQQKGGRIRRESCDACFLRQQESNTTSPCKRYGNTQTCTGCWSAGKPCSWTPQDKLMGISAVQLSREECRKAHPAAHPRWLRSRTAIYTYEHEETHKAIRKHRCASRIPWTTFDCADSETLEAEQNIDSDNDGDIDQDAKYETDPE